MVAPQNITEGFCSLRPPLRRFAIQNVADSLEQLFPPLVSFLFLRLQGRNVIKYFLNLFDQRRRFDPSIIRKQLCNRVQFLLAHPILTRSAASPTSPIVSFTISANGSNPTSERAASRADVFQLGRSRQFRPRKAVAVHFLKEIIARAVPLSSTIALKLEIRRSPAPPHRIAFKPLLLRLAVADVVKDDARLRVAESPILVMVPKHIMAQLQQSDAVGFSLLKAHAGVTHRAEGSNLHAMESDLRTYWLEATLPRQSSKFLKR